MAFRLLLPALASFAALAPVSAQAPVDANDVRARLQVYLSTYETELSTLTAEERFTQWPGRSTGSTRVRADAHVLVSDVAFVPLPANAGWLGYRAVRSVNRRPVGRSGPRLAELLTLGSDDARERAMALLLDSARHNLGAHRTINLPSLPLELLHARNQARFVIERWSTARIGDCHAVRLDLAEAVTPTLIQRPKGGNMPSRVAAWVEPATGRLCKAEVRTRDGQLAAAFFEAIITVEFAHDEALGLTVPTRMDEVFFNPPSGRGVGEALYTNYRRFTTSARIVPQP